MNIDLQDVMARLVSEKDSASDKRIPLSIVCTRPEGSEHSKRWLWLDEISGYRLKRNAPVVVEGKKAFIGSNAGGTWFTKFSDYPSLRRAALGRTAQYLLKGEAGAEVILCEDHVGAGMAVARWTSEAFFAGQPTEAIFKSYSMVGGKLCWGKELRGQEAIEFVTSLLQVELPKPGPIPQVTV